MPPTSLPDPALPRSDAERIFEDYLVDLERGAAPDFDLLLRLHPAQTAELRELRAQLAQVQAMVAVAGIAGAGADAPHAGCGEEDESTSRFSAEVLRRLAGRSAAAGRYRLLGEVAHGGMGQVLRVWDEDLRRQLAMKVIRGRQGPAGEQLAAAVPAHLLARFLEEAQVNAQLDHPGIVPVHELGLDSDGRVYFTMKLVEGMTLAAVYEQLARGEGGWTQARVLGVLLKVCEAVSYAHAKGVIHRDLKPLNVMVGRFGEVYVMDWGLAKVMEAAGSDEHVQQPVPIDTDRKAWCEQSEGASRLHLTDGGVGTPGYTAPEQWRGAQDEVGPHSDVYSMGAMLACLLTGARPAVKPRPVAELAPGAPAELAAICDKAMAREWRLRYRDMAELAQDLEAFQEFRAVGAYRTGPWIDAQKWVHRNRSLAASLAAALLAVVVGLGAYGVQSQRAADAERLVSQSEKVRADAAERERTHLERAQAAEREVLERERAARAQDYVQSAELSAQRGAWRQALEQLSLARDEGFADEARLLVREAEALQALSERERCNATLDRIEALGGAGELSGEVELIRGDLAMSEWEHHEAALAHLERARELGLSLADSAYVAGLLSDRSEQALAHFDRAIEADPFHHGALSAKSVLLVFLGRSDEARRTARRMSAIYPDDPAPPTVEAALLAHQGRFEESAAVCSQIAARHGAETALFSELMLEAHRALASMGLENWYGGGPPIDPFLMLGLFGKVTRMAQGDGLAALGSTGPNLPSLRKGFSVILPTLMSPVSSPERVEQLAEAFEHHPDGFLEYLRAAMLLNLPEEGEVTKLAKMRWSAAAFGRAGETPSLIPGMQRAARFWQLRCLEFVAIQGPEPRLYESLRPLLEHFAELEPRLLAELPHLARIALSAGEADLARAFALAWRELAPAGDPAPLRALARAELADGRPEAALELLAGLLESSPEDGDLLALRDRTLAALRELIGRFGG